MINVQNVQAELGASPDAEQFALGKQLHSDFSGDAYIPLRIGPAQRDGDNTFLESPILGFCVMHQTSPFSEKGGLDPCVVTS